MTKEQKSKLFRHLFNLIFSVEHKSLLPKEARVTINKGEDTQKQYLFTLVEPAAMRGYECTNFDGQHIIIMEQNPAGYSPQAMLAKWKYLSAWIWIQKKPYPARERKWLAYMIERQNGEVGIFSGRNIMTRVYYLMRDEIDARKEAVMYPDA